MTTFTGHLTDAQAQRLLDGALDSARDAGVERHAAACPECQALVESYRALADALGDLDPAAAAPLPDGFTAGVMARIDARERLVARERRLALTILGGAMAAAVAVVAVAGAGAWAPTVARWVDGLGEAAHAFRVGSTFVPTLVGVFRVQILVVAAVAAAAVLFALSRLVPARDARTA
ncbi:MAG TPA: anti-sigma factor [Anaeromyxobacteraceae bacterium]|nr:anti-sigma factor [Anaeromyxobacteraceae bacterium]